MKGSYMKKKKQIKTIPLFESEDQESSFWNKVDSTRYFSGEGRVRLKLSPRTTTISLRVPEKLLERLKKLAQIKDVPYQSLLKIYLDEKVRDEIGQLKKAA